MLLNYVYALVSICFRNFRNSPQGRNDKMVPISSGDLSLKKKLLNPHGQQMTMIVKKGQST